MNLSPDALKDLTAHAELKAEGGILERQFLLPKVHAINDHLHVDVPSLEGLHVALRVKRVDAFDGRSGVSCGFRLMDATS